MTRLPLLERGLDEVLARRGGEPVAVRSFLGEVERLAAELPARRYAVNLCRDRYRFSVAFAAVMLAGQTNLLPANRLDTTIREVLSRYPDAYVLSDDPEDRDWPGAVIVGPDRQTRAATAIPQLDARHLAAVVFTSGSTGASKAVEKPWSTFYESTRINAREMGLVGRDEPISVIATVPPQHMYGLETSVLMALFGDVAISNERPFMPADVASALTSVPSPRVLVSTPAHLRALADPQLTLPPIERIWSATAPLDPHLAGSIERLHGTRVGEIYGCSELGSLARRLPARDPTWALFPEFELHTEPAGTRVGAAHLPCSFLLQDRLELDGPGRFRIIGRDEDLVNVAGKRASLAELNQALLRTPGVEDGVLFEPPEAEANGAQRLAALVVAPGVDAPAIRRSLRQEIDEAFLPRPIRRVEALPRNETGKLTRQALLDLFARSATPEEKS